MPSIVAAGSALFVSVLGARVVSIAIVFLGRALMMVRVSTHTSVFTVRQTMQWHQYRRQTLQRQGQEQ